MQKILEQMAENMKKLFPLLEVELKAAERRFHDASARYEQAIEKDDDNIWNDSDSDFRQDYYDALMAKVNHENYVRRHKLVMDEIEKREEMIRIREQHSCYYVITDSMKVALEEARKRLEKIEENFSVSYNPAEFEKISARFAEIEALEEELKTAEKELTLVEAKKKACEDALRYFNIAAEILGTNA